MEQDKIMKFLAYDGTVSITCAKTTNLVEAARKIHGLNPTPTAALGRFLTIGVIMGANLKSDKDKITLKIKGDGPLESMIAVVNNKPQIKGYVNNPMAEMPLREDGKLNVGGVVGKNGYLNVVKDIGLKDPYVGTVPLVSGEIAEDFASYFATSEQTPCVVALGVLVDKTGEVLSAGGYVITTMPDVSEETIKDIEYAIQNINPISQMLSDNMSLPDIARECIGNKNVQIIEDNIIPEYKCDCSRQRVEKALIAMGKEELQKIIEEDGKAELECHFCLKKYYFTKEELEEIVTIHGRF